MARLPHPVRPNFSWLQGALILATARDLVTPECQFRTRSDGVYHQLRRVLNIRKWKRSFWFNKALKKNRLRTAQGSVVSKKDEKKPWLFSGALASNDNIAFYRKMLRTDAIVCNLSKFKANVKISRAQNPQNKKSGAGTILSPILKNDCDGVQDFGVRTIAVP